MLALNIGLAVNLIILFFAFFFRPNNSLPNKILALLLLDTAISFLGNASVIGGFFADFPYLFLLSWCTSSFFGPLFYTYTRLLTGSAVKLSHPIVLASLLCSVFGVSFPVHYLLLPNASRSAFIHSLTAEPLPWQMTVLNILTMLIILTSMAASAIEVRKYKKRLLRNLSNLATTKLGFISRFVLLGLILTVSTIVLYLSLPQYLVEYLYLPCLITLIYIFILYYTFRHHAIFTLESYQQFLLDTAVATEPVRQSKTELQKVTISELDLLAQKVQDYLSKTEVYTNPDLTIHQLAAALGVHPETLSSSINKVLGKNFYDLINEHRVKKAQQLLLEKSAAITIEHIGYRAGFNSRPSFYRAFKKLSHLSPSQYLQQQAQNP